MKRLIDIKCPSCEAVQIDVFADVGNLPICSCGTQTHRMWGSRGTSKVIVDDIPGGVLMEHGICNADGTPRRYYSKTEIARAAKEKGLENRVRHIGERGSDRSPHTSRWV